jgi:hypothetical protein
MIRHPKVAEAVAPIAGRFKVLRIEVGGLQMPLRQIITLQLERFLEKLGVDYTFPTADKELNNKDSFEEMMAAFGEKFPDQGLAKAFAPLHPAAGVLDQGLTPKAFRAHQNPAVGVFEESINPDGALAHGCKGRTTRSISRLPGGPWGRSTVQPRAASARRTTPWAQ